MSFPERQRGFALTRQQQGFGTLALNARVGRKMFDCLGGLVGGKSQQFGLVVGDLSSRMPH
ncbi:MAG: hypothetical protein ACKVHO_26145, partial [Verrucomicrobiia bacterium]